jgi:phasin
MPDIETTTREVKDQMKKAARTVKVEGQKFEAAAEQNFQAASAASAQFPEFFRELAEKSMEQAKDNYARMRDAAEGATDMVEDSYLTVTRGAAEFNLKAVEALRDNVNSSFDYARELLGAKSVSEALELSAAHMRHQFETLSDQAKEFSALARKVATDTAASGKNFRVN